MCKIRTICMVSIIGVLVLFLFGCSQEANTSSQTESGLANANESVADATKNTAENNVNASNIVVEETAMKTIEGNGYDSAEEAVNAYIEALTKGDISDIIATFAVETYVENINTEEYLSQLGVYSIAINAGNQIPSHDSKYELQIMAYSRAGSIAETSLYQMEYYYGFDDITTITSFNDNTEVESYIEDMENYNFDEIISAVKFIEFIEPEILSDTYSDRTAQALSNWKNRYGFDNYQDIVAHITIENKDYLLIIGCAQYDNRWYNLSFQGLLANYLGMSNYAGGLIAYDEFF